MHTQCHMHTHNNIIGIAPWGEGGCGGAGIAPPLPHPQTHFKTFPVMCGVMYVNMKWEYYYHKYIIIGMHAMSPCML